MRACVLSCVNYVYKGKNCNAFNTVLHIYCFTIILSHLLILMSHISYYFKNFSQIITYDIFSSII